MEEWKVWKENKMPKSHKLYALWEVSNEGNVKKNGELYECKLYNNYKIFGSGIPVHRAVATLFIPNPNNYNEVDHINGNKLDNQDCNLRWCTHKENCNNQITRKHIGEVLKGKNKNKHRIYHNDGTYHYEKNL